MPLMRIKIRGFQGKLDSNLAETGRHTMFLNLTWKHAVSVSHHNFQKYQQLAGKLILDSWWLWIYENS